VNETDRWPPDLTSDPVVLPVRYGSSLFLSFPFCNVHKKMCRFQAVASIIAHGRFLLRNLCTCSQYAVNKIRMHYIPLYSCMASSPEADIKNNFRENCTQPTLLFHLLSTTHGLAEGVALQLLTIILIMRVIQFETKMKLVVRLQYLRKVFYITQLQTRETEPNKDRDYNLCYDVCHFSLAEMVFC